MYIYISTCIDRYVRAYCVPTIAFIVPAGAMSAMHREIDLQPIPQRSPLHALVLLVHRRLGGVPRGRSTNPPSYAILCGNPTWQCKIPHDIWSLAEKMGDPSPNGGCEKKYHVFFFTGGWT